MKDESKKEKKDKKNKEEKVDKESKETEQAKKVDPEAEDLELTHRGQKRGDVTILLFYGYVKPVWSNFEQDAVINYCYASLQRHGCSGRLRVAREGLNSVITGTYDGIRAFTADLSA